MAGPRRVTEIATEARDGARIDDITYPGPDGEPVVAYLISPAAPAPDPGPAVLAWHWLDTEAPDGDRTQFVDEAVALAGFGVTSLLPQGRFPWTEAPTTATADVAAIEAEVGRLHLGLELVSGRPGVDATRLAVVGHDFGGMLATVAAARRPGLRALVVIAATPRWGDWFLPFWPITDDRIDYLRTLRPLDPIERIGDVAPTPVLFQFGRQDFFIAAMTGLEFRGAAADGAELIAYDEDHGMRGAQIRADRLAFLARHLDLPDATGPADDRPVPG
jgi:pimeloyl-ACP methyl ester carboxylesterase